MLRLVSERPFSISISRLRFGESATAFESSRAMYRGKLSVLIISVLASALLTSTISVLCSAAKGIGLNPGPVVAATRGEVWPRPQEVKVFTSFMMLRPNDFSFKVIKNDCEILQDAIQRYMKIIKAQQRPGSGTVAISEASGARLTAHRDFAGYLDTLKINLMKPCESMPYLNMDEKYELKVNTPDMPKNAVLVSSSIWGVLRGLETFSQLLYTAGSSPDLVLNGTMIMDFPRFPHRGLLLDTSRHFMPLKIIYDTLDAMSMNKLNVFHWHIVDDHSFPYQSTTFPRLNQYGAYSPVHVYTQNDVKNIIRYAAFRGIRVVAEFDSPGHTRSWGEGHPELLTKCYKKNVPDGSLGPMDPLKNSTYTFMSELLNEIKKVFPDPYTHLGGDEVYYDCWESNPDLIKYVQDNKISFQKLEELYIKKVIDLAKAKSLKSIVWQEVFDNGLDVPKDTIIHVWKTGSYQKELSTVTSSGYTALLSSPWYLDHVSSGGDWIKYYNVEPLDFEGSEESKRRVIGGEACMWSEHVDSTNVMTRVWPRACAAAEKLWSPANVKNYQQASRRLEEHACRLNMRGIKTQPPNGPGFCPYVNF